MFVFIAHAEADQAAADDLKAFLKSRGLVTETETGARGFRHLQASDVVVALWSQKSVFGAHRMMMERRMLDAWADGRLVLVKLDHGFLPVGLRDLPTIDASFESGRQLGVWPQVERAAREAMNRALVESQDRPKGVGSGGSSGSGPEAEERWSISRSKAAPSPAPGAPSPQATRPAPRIEISEDEVAAKAQRGSPLIGLMIIVAVAALGWAAWESLQAPTGEGSTLTYVAYGVAGLGLLLLLIVIAQAARPPVRVKAKKAEAPAPATEAAPAAEFAAPKSAATLFISYAHADNAAVTPVVDVVKANGRDVWIDKTGLQTGDSWAGEIVRAIKGAGGIMVMCSKHAFESDHVKRELYLADRYKKPLAPVFLEAAQPPEDFEYFFAGVQWLELYKLPEADRPAAIGRALSAV
jgi:hypothetical protein